MGTHENQIKIFDKSDNQVYIRKRGIDGYAKSYVYGVGEIRGMLIPHSENDTANQALTLYNVNGNIIYRPSNYYVYSPCDDAWESISDVRKSNYRMLSKKMSMRLPDIKSGYDAVGSLLIMKNDPINKILYGKNTKPVSFWAGTILSVQQVKKLGLKYSGPTTVQVAISILSALKWVLLFPNKGIVFPEDIPHDFILDNSKEWLGDMIFKFVHFNISKTTFADEFVLKNEL